MIPPFENYSENDEVAGILTDKFIEILITREDKPYKIFYGTKYVSREDELDLTQIELKTKRGLKLIKDKLGVDAVILGKVTHYLEAVKMDLPIKKSYFDKIRQRLEIWWEAWGTVYVMISASLTLIDPEDGRILFTDSRNSKSDGSKFYRINWNSDSAPPDHLIPQPDRTLIPKLLTNATAGLARELSKNFVTHRE